ncbi:dephospho-CoA kinase [Engelhardtia mirabilis]|uniref:Dephospho-CoA kinase n=1 Tax=Engelhardtia mirabilis TaxID=2528011 RepID=A0A518BNW7_9BACT|nr:Dephospho-CoA kinase [Planctomycetes bacterium Pla133]QDV02963.1 Dephospho-CoA kinase [Planctomycetes bacterium Pla86]
MPASDALRPTGPAATLVVGVLGGIASGKSLVATTLAGPMGVVIDADTLAHEVLASPEVSGLVAQAFGSWALGPDGSPDRAALARIVFSDPDRRRLLEGWIHPRVRANIRARLAEARLGGVPVAVLDVPLLLEHDDGHGLARECDALVFVDAALEDRDLRAVRDRGWPPGDVARRERAQLPLDRKRDRADHVLSNDGSREDLARAAAGLRAELLAADR